MLDDNGIRPPIIAAGINLFGGPLGLLHRHVTGALPIRRNTKDPVYLITLKAYVAEMLRAHDFFYPEGGRSYSGEMKTPKTGLMHAASGAFTRFDHPDGGRLRRRARGSRAGPAARQARAACFSRELAEMVRYAVGYKSRAFVTFGKPMSVKGIDPNSRRAVLDLCHEVMERIGRQYRCCRPRWWHRPCVRRSRCRT